MWHKFLIIVRLSLLSVVLLNVAGCSESEPLAAPQEWSKTRAVAQVENPGDMATDGKSLYVVATPLKPPAGEIVRVSLADGKTDTLVKGEYFPENLFLDDVFLYWTDSRQNAIMRVHTGGGEASKVVSGLYRPRSLAVDGGRVYWITGGRDPEKGGFLQSVNKFEPNDLTTHDINLTNNHVMVDATHVFWMSVQGLRWLNKTDNTTGTLYDAAGRFTVGLAQDNDSLYFFQQSWSYGPSALIKMPKTGGNATTLATGPIATQFPLAVSEDAVFFFTTDGPLGQYTLRQVAKNGGAATALDAGDSINSLLAGAAQIYLTGNGKLLSLAR